MPTHDKLHSPILLSLLQHDETCLPILSASPEQNAKEQPSPLFLLTSRNSPCMNHILKMEANLNQASVNTLMHDETNVKSEKQKKMADQTFFLQESQVHLSDTPNQHV